METISTVEFYEAVKELAGNSDSARVNARKISDYVEQTKQTNYSTLKDVFLTKDDKADLSKQIADSKTSMILWMFVFWIGQVAVSAGIIISLLKK